MGTSTRKIPIVIYLPSKYVVKLSVAPSAYVNELRRIITINNIDFVFNGTILSGNQTFRSAGLKSGDSIVVIFHKSNSDKTYEELQKWLQITQDSESFNEKMQLILNEDNAREAARLRDVFLSKIERKPRSFRRLCLAVAENNKNKEREVQGNNFSLSIDYEKPEMPSCDPLPIFFTSEDGQGIYPVAKDETIIPVTDSISPVLKP
ncbi:hypothetical protein TRFO_32455 [Tritrichomonas foetus]|uniref:Ubiquitin-like domain-containing protein n=1 Tax=Tritrichomonas foetus TaxID=1144522 RepID=A0A1J4JTA9_9EUKA|nr:hypothetical protein TRFO_32455 [Tritrichomonas foetus]|eukprot:OHT00732.1 hypothetical protein TRFO_32455 [Tritrichomonas foetus]